MAKLTDSEVNVSAIRRVDPLVKDLVDSATHVALYSFNGMKNEWDKTNIEGALFVYKRKENPLYSMFILNRNSPENLIEPVVKELDLQLQNPFILYKNKQGLIYGIWFYNKEDCHRISDVLQKLVKELTLLPSSSKPNPKPKKSSEQMGNGLIMNMLSKAQEEYNSHKSPMRSEKPKELESAPQSVMDFFAKAGVSQGVGETHLPQPPGYAPPAAIPIIQRPAYVVPSPAAPVAEVSHPIIQRIMSNPVHSVEHIEKQQRSITPGARGKDVAVGDIDNTMLFMRISDSPIPTQQFFNSNLTQQVDPLHMNGIEHAESNKSALMPPTMFTSSSTSKDAGDKLMNGILATEPIPSKQIDPLTKNQLAQALSHLLKHDAGFVNRLHEAYLDSFKDIVST